MVEGKQCHRGLLPVVVALVVAMAGAFGLASTSATADSAETLDKKQVELKVTGIESGVTGTAYKYMKVNWDNSAGQPGTPQYLFEDGMRDWMEKRGGGSVF